ncbi:MAG TPA: LacI family transcriptional regulator [Ruminococcaceae bacterium]|jgi:L-arabinose transport system substrate-binding protein|nr:LacI family transcriptional regulator [Oscillospiraceae bacterium]
MALSLNYKKGSMCIMKKGKFLRAAIALTLTAALFAGCSSSSGSSSSGSTSSAAASSGSSAGKEAKDIVLAGIYKMGDATWFIQEGKASEEMAKKMGASKFLYIDAKQSGDTYMKALDNVITQKVDGVLVCTPDQNLSQVTVKKLTAANIPVIAVDDALQDESGTLLAPWVGIDAYNIGASAGEWIANYIKTNNLVNDSTCGIMYLTAETVSSCVPRTKGAQAKVKEIIPDFPANRTFSADYDTNTESGNKAANTIITAHPEIKKWMVIPVSDEGAAGAARAIEAAGLQKDSCCIGLGGYLAPGEFAKKTSPFKAAAYFSARDVGGTAAKEMMEYLTKGTAIKEKYAVSATIVTPTDDLKTIMPEYMS